MSTTFDYEDIYRLRNSGDKDFTAEYEFRRYQIPAGAETWLPGGCVVAWLGDPNSQTVRNGQPVEDRYYEAQRMHSQYGSYNDIDAWEENKPKLEVFDGNGDRIITVVDDPSGMGQDGPQLIMPSQEAAMERLERLEAESRLLRAQLSATVPGSVAPVTLEEPQMPDTPAPTTPPVDRPNRLSVG